MELLIKVVSSKLTFRLYFLEMDNSNNLVNIREVDIIIRESDRVLRYVPEIIIHSLVFSDKQLFELKKWLIFN